MLIDGNVSITWVEWGADEAALTQLEYELYEYFLRNAGRTCTHREIALAVWGEELLNQQRWKVPIYALVSRLRSKLRLDPGRALQIRTVHGRGYKPHTNGR